MLQAAMRLLLGIVPALAAGGLQQAHGSATNAGDGPAAHEVAASNADRAWRPTDTQKQRVLATTQAYFAARDAQRFDEAYTFLSLGQRQLLPAESFREMVEDFNLRAGTATGRRLTRFTWYRDTPEAGPGLYVAIDFSGGFTNLPVHCGYVVWREQADGSFLHIREEAEVIDRMMVATLDAADLERLRARLRC